MASDDFDFYRVLPETEQLPASDSRAASEGKAIADYRWRLEHLKQSVHVAIVWAVRVASISMLLLFVVRVFHLAAPDVLMWVKPERLQKIDSLLFSGFVGAFIARYLNQAMPMADGNKK